MKTHQVFIIHDNSEPALAAHETTLGEMEQFFLQPGGSIEIDVWKTNPKVDAEGKPIPNCDITFVNNSLDICIEMKNWHVDVFNRALDTCLNCLDVSVSVTSGGETNSSLNITFDSPVEAEGRPEWTDKLFWIKVF